MSRSNLLPTLADIVGGENVLTGDAAGAYLREWRGAFEPVALAVVRPDTTEAVTRVVRACVDADCALVTQSGNTGLVGGAAATDEKRHVIINLERMNRVRAIDPSDMTITVEAGCILADVKAAAVDAGLYYPLSLASEGQCRIGGNLASNAGGLNVVRYGNTRDLTLGLEVVLADGRIWNGLTSLRKDNSGFDLRDLFIGSEGALGVITAATLKLFHPVRQRATALCGLHTPADALALIQALKKHAGDNVVACELMSHQAVRLACRHGRDCVMPFAVDEHAWFLLVELGSSADGDWLAPILQRIIDQAQTSGRIRTAVIADNAEQAAGYWRIRESIPAAQTAEGASIKHDVSVPVGQIPVFLDRALARVQDMFPGVRPCPFGHVGDGNIHFNLTRPLDMDDAEFMRRADDAHRLVHDIVSDMGGSIAAEHGVGRLKYDELVRYKQPVELDLNRAIKTALDPDNRLNPGVIVDAWVDTRVDALAANDSGASR